jgi:predicted nucleotidyltransferase
MIFVSPHAVSISSDEGPTLVDLRKARHAVLETAARHGAFNVRVFGSVARGTATASSDIDLLVDLEHGRTLFDLAALWRDLESLLGRHVDVVSAGGLTDRDDDVRSEAVPL